MFQKSSQALDTCIFYIYIHLYTSIGPKSVVLADVHVLRHVAWRAEKRDASISGMKYMY